MKTRLSALLVFVLFAVSASVFAQGTATFVLTETFINQTYRVTNPPRTSITNVSVDLQVGQVVINATFTPRRTNVAISTATTMYPTVANGNVTWTVTSITANGVAANQDIVTQVNASIASSWRVYFRNQTGDNLQSIVIDDLQITYGFGTESGANPNIIRDVTGTTVTVSESDINAVLTPRGNVTSISADLQANQVVMNATINTTRLGAVSASVTLVPTLADGKVTWTATSVIVNGAAATGSTKTTASNALSGVWRSYWNTHQASRVVTSYSITDTILTYTWTQ